MRFLYVLYSCLCYPFIWLFCPCRVTGRGNIPKGPAIVCANHSSNFDPVMMALYFGMKHQLYFMAKAELLEIPVLGPMLRGAGVFPIKRGNNTDIKAIRTAMGILKDGGKVMIFPEGTRVLEGESVAAKSGAVRIAAKLNVPILPVFLTSGRKAFRINRMVIGEPYHITAPADKNYEAVSDELLNKIRQLEPEN